MRQVEVFGQTDCERTDACVQHFWDMGVSPLVILVDDPWTEALFDSRAPGCKLPIVFIAGKLIGDDLAVQEFELLHVQQMIGGE